MLSNRSYSRSPERRSAVEALHGIASRMPLPVLISWLPVLEASALATTGASPRMVERMAEKLSLLFWWAGLRQTNPDAPDQELFRQVVQAVRAVDPSARVSARSLRTWRDAFNKVQADGLAAGPSGLLDRYRTGPMMNPQGPIGRSFKPRLMGV